MISDRERMGRTYIIAEAGVNHNGSLSMALRLVDAASAAGADAVKFQTFRASSLVTGTAAKASYQQAATGRKGTQLDMLLRLELDETAHRTLAARCRLRGIRFLSTPFDEESIDLLVKRIRVPLLKVPSGEITNGPLLLRAARTGKRILLSTGMSTLRDIEAALGVLAFGYLRRREAPSQAAFQRAYASSAGKGLLRTKVTLLHCTTEYPAPFEDVNLRAMDTMRDAFGLAVGYSDHTKGIAVPVAAVARGAVVIEKHVTLDKNLPGPDHRASLDPSEFADMVRAVRAVERCLGTGVKRPAASERKNMVVARRSIVASRDIRRGEIFTPENISCKRPAKGISPMLFWRILGRKSKKDLHRNEVIVP